MLINLCFFWLGLLANIFLILAIKINIGFYFPLFFIVVVFSLLIFIFDDMIKYLKENQEDVDLGE